MKRILIALCLVLPLAAQSQTPAPGAPQPPGPRAGVVTAPGGRVLPGTTPAQPNVAVGGMATPASPSNLQIVTNVGGQAMTPSATVIPGNTEEIQNLQATLLNLQSNMEQALPALYRIVQTTRGSTQPMPGQTNGLGGQMFVTTIGTNSIGMNRETLQLLSTVVTELQRTIPALRALNGTSFVGPGGAAVQGSTLANRFTPIQAPGTQLAPNGQPVNPTAGQQNPLTQRPVPPIPMLPTGR